MKKCNYCEIKLTPDKIRPGTNGSGKPHTICQLCYSMLGRICDVSKKNNRLTKYVNNPTRQAKWAAQRAQRDEQKAKQVPPSQPQPVDGWPFLEATEAPEPAPSVDQAEMRLFLEFLEFKNSRKS